MTRAWKRQSKAGLRTDLLTLDGTSWYRLRQSQHLTQFLVSAAAVLLLFPVSGCQTFMDGYRHGSTRSAYEGKWWDVIQDDPAQRSGYKRLNMEVAFSQGIADCVERNGLPDQLHVSGSGYVELAYWSQGKIYRFKDSVRGQLLSSYSAPEAGARKPGADTRQSGSKPQARTKKSVSPQNTEDDSGADNREGAIAEGVFDQIAEASRDGMKESHRASRDSRHVTVDPHKEREIASLLAEASSYASAAGRGTRTLALDIYSSYRANTSDLGLEARFASGKALALAEEIYSEADPRLHDVLSDHARILTSTGYGSLAVPFRLRSQVGQLRGQLEDSERQGQTEVAMKQRKDLASKLWETGFEIYLPMGRRPLPGAAQAQRLAIRFLRESILIRNQIITATKPTGWDSARQVAHELWKQAADLASAAPSPPKPGRLRWEDELAPADRGRELYALSARRYADSLSVYRALVRGLEDRSPRHRLLVPLEREVAGLLSDYGQTLSDWRLRYGEAEFPEAALEEISKERSQLANRGITPNWIR